MAVPFELEGYFLKRIRVDYHPAPDGVEIAETNVKLSLDYRLAVHKENPHAYQMTLRISGGEGTEANPKCGYDFSAVIVGRYTITIDSPEAESHIARVNGVSALYSTFRGILGSTTGLFEDGKLMLPSIDPRDVVAEVEKALAAKEAEAASVNIGDNSPGETPS